MSFVALTPCFPFTASISISAVTISLWASTPGYQEPPKIQGEGRDALWFTLLICLQIWWLEITRIWRKYIKIPYFTTMIWLEHALKYPSELGGEGSLNIWASADQTSNQGKREMGWKDCSLSFLLLEKMSYNDGWWGLKPQGKKH